MKFRATVQLNGKTATGIEVPPQIVDELGTGRRPAVTVTIRDYTYRSTVASMGGRYLIPVSADVRQRAGVTAGDEVEVHLERDTAPREVEVPADFAAALDAAPEARRFFDQLSYSNTRWHVLQVTGAKTAETRLRRIDKSITRLSKGQAR